MFLCTVFSAVTGVLLTWVNSHSLQEQGTLLELCIGNTSEILKGGGVWRHKEASPYPCISAQSKERKVFLHNRVIFKGSPGEPDYLAVHSFMSTIGVGNCCVFYKNGVCEWREAKPKPSHTKSSCALVFKAFNFLQASLSALWQVEGSKLN